MAKRYASYGAPGRSRESFFFSPNRLSKMYLNLFNTFMPEKPVMAVKRHTQSLCSSSSVFSCAPPPFPHEASSCDVLYRLVLMIYVYGVMMHSEWQRLRCDCIWRDLQGAARGRLGLFNETGPGEAALSPRRF